MKDSSITSPLQSGSAICLQISWGTASTQENLGSCARLVWDLGMSLLILEIQTKKPKRAHNVMVLQSLTGLA